MSKFAVYGLLGTIPFLYIIFIFIKGSIKYFDKEYSFYFMLSIFSIIILGLLKAISGIEVWFVFFVIAPGSYYLSLLKEIKILKQCYNDKLGYDKYLKLKNQVQI